MLSHSTNEAPGDSEALALAALAATLSDERRALRFLDLTGLTADELRNRAERDACSRQRWRSSRHMNLTCCRSLRQSG